MTLLQGKISSLCPYNCGIMTEAQNPKEAVKAALAPIMQDMIAVDRILREELTTSQSEIIAKVGNYIVEAGGKRMRPALLMLMARALGYEGTLHQELGATIEMLHTATLMHDDVVDEGMMRRGRPTANAQWGNNVAVLVGDGKLVVCILFEAGDKGAPYTVVFLHHGGGVRLPLIEITNHRNCRFVLFVGTKRLIKRRLLDEYLEQCSTL